IVTDRPAVERERQLEDARQLRFEPIENLIGEALRLQSRAIDVWAAGERAGTTAVADDVVDLFRCISQPSQRRRNGGVDDLEVATAGELLELDQREVRFDASGIAIHYQSDSASRRDARDLRIAIAVLLTQCEHAVAVLSRRL